MARVLANSYQLVIRDMIGPEQNYYVKGRLAHDNFHLVHYVLEELEDGTEVTLFNFDQSKSFDRIDHRILATVLETARFKLDFRKWISMIYHNPEVMAPVNRRPSEAFEIEHWFRQGCRLSPLLYVLTLESLLRRLRDEMVRPALRRIPFVDDITVFVSRCLDIKSVKKVVVWYKLRVGAKINLDKSEGLWLCAWSGGVPLPGLTTGEKLVRSTD